jgi:three-Cys-motif partner protein
MPRDWGPWTVIKLDALERYFRAFTIASRKANRTLYLDLFGGRPENQGRHDGRLFNGSAVRAAATTPKFSRLVVSELDRKAALAQRTALAEVAGSRAEVLTGDCNRVVPDRLTELAREDPEWRWAPTFALVDQFSAEVEWTTLQAVAAFKNPRARTKAEIFMLIAPGFNLRGIHGPSGKINRPYVGQIHPMFGTLDWRMILAAREDELLTAAQTRDEMVNLMRWRLVNILGYRWCVPLTVVNTHGRQIFDLLFATDWPADRLRRCLRDRGVDHGLSGPAGHRDREMAADSGYTDVVRRLGCLRGISTLTGFGLAVGIGDWTRFTGATIGAFVGLVPTEHSSGRSRAQGSITKTGNGHARRLLVEAGGHHAKPYRAPGKVIRDRWDLAPAPARVRGHEGNRRLHQRWRTFNARKKKPTIANVAVARELAGWAWSLAVME